MASGKSLELREIKQPPGEPVCICGDLFTEHWDMTKEPPELKEKYGDGSKHYQAGLRGRTLRREV